MTSHRSSSCSTMNSGRIQEKDFGEGPPDSSTEAPAANFDVERGPPPKEKGMEDPNIVTYDGPNDPENPLNWPQWKKWVVTIAMALMTFVVSFGSSVFSTATVPTAKQFRVSTEVMVLGTSLYLVGFAIGPLLFGPLSELYGRKKPLFLGLIIFTIFQIPVAVAQNLTTIMLCRFLEGFFGSSALAVVGGALADFWDPINRGIAICVFSSAVFVGPMLGPIIGGFITKSYLGWRWTAYITLIMGVFFTSVGFLLVPETYASTILQTKAKRLRYETKNWAIHAKAEENQVDLKAIVLTYLLRPLTMLVQEPILILITLYMSLIYGIIYLCFEAYPISFQEHRGWNAGVGALPFLGIMLGVYCAVTAIVLVTKTRYARKFKENGGVEPEDRLLLMMVGAVLLPIGLFWFAWTSNPNISWVAQVFSGLPLGAGIMMIFLQGLNYIIDVYRMYANSAISANTIVRSLVGAGFPLFATPMYRRLGVAWATSLLGFLAVAMIPVPFLFYIYGKKIRQMSKYSPT